MGLFLVDFVNRGYLENSAQWLLAFFLSCPVNDSLENIKNCFWDYLYWHPYFASFAKSALEWDQLPVVLD